MMAAAPLLQRRPSSSSSRKERLPSTHYENTRSSSSRWESQLSLGRTASDGAPATTSTTKEVVVSEVEASASTTVNPLVSMSVEPRDVVDSFEKLMKFCSECSSVSRHEVVLVTYPVFIHVCLYLFAKDCNDKAKYLNDKFSSSFESSQREISELFSFSSKEDLLASALAAKFRDKKYSIRMSSKAFQLLMRFLLILHSPFLMTLVQRHLALDVYGSTVPSVATEAQKQEPKKSPSFTFTKPRVPQLDENRLQARMKEPSRITLCSTTTSKISPKVTPPTKLAKLAEYKDALASAADCLDPTPPSLSMYTVQSTDNVAHCASLNSASKLYACGFADSSIHVWPQEPCMPGASHVTIAPPISGSDHRRLVGHCGPVYSTSFSNDGRFLVSGSEDCSAQLWDLERNASVVCYQGHAYPVWDVTFSPIDVHFASASMDHTARLWTTDLTFPLRLFTGHTSHVNMVRFHPNGHYVATGSHDRSCRLWDIDTGQCVRLMTCTKSSQISIAFSPNGKELASGGLDGVTRIWDLGTGDLVREYPPPTNSTRRGGVTTLAYSVDSTLLAVGSHCDCVNVYNTRPGSTVPCDSENAVLSLNATPTHCSVLQLQFTHRNCLVGISKLDTPPKELDSTNSFSIEQ